ncbi:MAG: DMSO/TMAO reductase YedYZ molybdopterin-dependent catalytic subunit [Ilumatobacter sp.]|jgi:DMSO/TMAO reductase YedYZ molybdopterin-dependent catalytic subunit
MRSTRRTGIRTTVVCPADPRAAGAYEQTADWPSHGSLYSATSRFLDPDYSLTVTGLVDTPRTLRYSDLVGLATFGPNGTFGLPLRDLMSAVRLVISAEILVVEDLHGRSFAVPIRDALEFESAQLLLGTSQSALRRIDGGPVRLDIPGWTTPSEALAVTSIRAVTFAELLGCS